MQQGVVKWIDLQKGFGFIECQDGIEIFLHKVNLHSDIESIQAGSEVIFEVAESERGLIALNVLLKEDENEGK